MCHPGISKMKFLARCYMWWTKLDEDIESCVWRCGMCQDSANMSQTSALHPWEWSGRPCFRVHTDYAVSIKSKWILGNVDVNILINMSFHQHLLHKKKGCCDAYLSHKGVHM